MRMQGELMFLMGQFGGGKTAFATTWALRQRRRHPDRPVYANYDLALPVGEPCRFIEDRSQILDVHDADLIVDEAQNWFPNRDYTKFTEEYRAWFSQVRKSGTRVLMISQTDDIDKFIRSRVQTVIKVASWRRLGFFFATLYSDMDCKQDQRFAFKWIWFNPLVFGLYSHDKRAAEL